MGTATRIIMNLSILLIRTCEGVIFINVILSWILPPNHSVKQFFNFLTAPILGPIRRMMQPLMAKSQIPLDLSPIIAFIFLSILEQLLYMLFSAI
jgi:uncharacterized protein YggT (Ycf19 family)